MRKSQDRIKNIVAVYSLQGTNLEETGKSFNKAMLSKNDSIALLR